MKILDVLTTRFGLIVLGIICIALLICCACKYCSSNKDDSTTRNIISYRNTISEEEAFDRRLKFIEDYIELRKTLKDYISKNNRSNDDVIVVVSPSEIYLGTKIQN